MFIKSLVVGPLQVNCYIIGDVESRKSMVIDPGDEPDRILDVIKEKDFTVDYVVCTHGHFDHVGAVSDIKKETGGKVVLNREEMEIYEAARDMAAFWGFDIDPLPDPDLFVSEGDLISVGSLEFKVFASPGHSPGGICLYREGLVITGDTLFAGSIGRTDFHGGSMSLIGQSFRRLMELPADTRVLSGHGPVTTIGHEKKFNMFSAQFLR
ncbi:MAG TPA: MBL fold metallo-hydrolase [Dissulfurispiraceae bacterium]|jgi:hydroxyacylglutathione hydrolase|nr:MBL fold metallo-hydrolase [Dissulfurispiraceae bacterium]